MERAISSAKWFHTFSAFAYKTRRFFNRGKRVGQKASRSENQNGTTLICYEFASYINLIETSETINIEEPYKLKLGLDGNNHMLPANCGFISLEKSFFARVKDCPTEYPVTKWVTMLSKANQILYGAQQIIVTESSLHSTLAFMGLQPTLQKCPRDEK